MQMIVRNKIADYDDWKTAFDDAAEARMHAGLSVLQIWRDVGDPGTVWYLLDVNDKGKADAYMQGDSARLLADRAGVTEAEYHLVDTI